MTDCPRCGKPFESPLKSQRFCSRVHKREWEEGRTLVINALEAMGLIGKEAIDRALQSAGGQEQG